MLTDLFHDLIDGQLTLRGAQNIGKAVLGPIQRDFSANQRREREKPGHSPFKHTDVARNTVSKKFEDAGSYGQVWVLRPELRHLVLQHTKAQFKVGRVQVYDQTGLEARTNAFFKISDIRRRTISRNNDLFALVDQSIERVEEFVLRAFFARNELNIVHHEHVNRTEQLFEADRVFFAQRLDKAVHELLSRQIQHAQVRLAGLKFPRDGLHEVGFTQAYATIQKQRVKSDGIAGSHTTGRGMGQFVGLAHDKRVKRKARIERRARKVGVDSHGRFACSDGRRRDRSLGRRCRSRIGHDALKTISADTGCDAVAQNHIGVVLGDPRSNEVGRRDKAQNASVQTFKPKRLNPGSIVIVPNRFANLIAHRPPGIICHCASFPNSDCRRIYVCRHGNPLAFQPLSAPRRPCASQSPSNPFTTLMHGTSKPSADRASATAYAALSDLAPDRQINSRCDGTFPPMLSINVRTNAGLGDISG